MIVYYYVQIHYELFLIKCIQKIFLDIKHHTGKFGSNPVIFDKVMKGPPPCENAVP